MKVLLSIHDTTPYFEKEISILAEKLADYKKSWLITPLWDGKYHFQSAFTSVLKGDEKILHGLTHRGKSDLFSTVLFLNNNLSRELRGLNRSETADNLKRGISLFEDSFAQPPKGYIPPNWYHNRYSLDLLRELGFSFTETWTSVLGFDKNTSFRTLPMSFDYGKNFLLSRFCLWYSRMQIEHTKPDLIRFAVHPQDINHGYLDPIMSRIRKIKESGYRFYSYEEITTSP